MQCKTGVANYLSFVVHRAKLFQSFAFFCRKGGIFKKQNNPDFPANQQLKGI